MEGSFPSATLGRSDESLPHSDGNDPSISQRGYAQVVSIAKLFDEDQR
jgi:hypothetical protein